MLLSLDESYIYFGLDIYVCVHLKKIVQDRQKQTLPQGVAQASCILQHLYTLAL